ncbi:MAG: hypothetical protein ACKKL4_02300 [Patescibacteria group bacterium]
MGYTNELGKTAWKYLIHEAKKMPVGELAVDSLHDRINSWMRSAPAITDADCCMWEFCNDIASAVWADVRDDESASDFHLCSEARYKTAYTVLTYLLLYKSVRVGKNLKREVNSLAKEMGVQYQDAHNLMRVIVPDMIESAFD